MLLFEIILYMYFVFVFRIYIFNTIGVYRFIQYLRYGELIWINIRAPTTNVTVMIFTGRLPCITILGSSLNYL